MAVGNIRLGTGKQQQEQAAATVCWRSNKSKGIKMGVSSCNFKTMKKILEAEDMVVPVPRGRVVKK